MSQTILAAQDPLLRPTAFRTLFHAPLGELESPPWLLDLLSTGAHAPLQPDDSVRSAVRDALRRHGYKPTGRGKPASEYLLRAAGDGALGSINLAVDACNVVSLHSGFPISVIDLDRATPPLEIRVAADDASYVFNPSGQEMRLGGLPCLFDAAGPCANAVKDSQRTKTGPGTRATLSVLWACHPHEERARSAVAWYQELLTRAGASVHDIPIESGARRSAD